MIENERKASLGELVKLAMDCMGVAVTIIDTKATTSIASSPQLSLLVRACEMIPSTRAMVSFTTGNASQLGIGFNLANGY